MSKKCRGKIIHFRKEELKKIDAVALNRWGSGEYYTPADWGQGSYAKCPAMSLWQGPPKRGSSIVAARFDRLSGSIDYIYGWIYYPVPFIFGVSSLFLVLTDVRSIFILKVPTKLDFWCGLAVFCLPFFLFFLFVFKWGNECKAHFHMWCCIMMLDVGDPAGCKEKGWINTVLVTVHARGHAQD